MKLIAIIPARVNSRRLPHKNFKPFFRKVMLSWVLEEIEKAELFDKVIVSTDISTVTDQYIFTGDIFKWHIRKNPTYEQTVDDVCLEVLQEYPDYDYLCCIYSTNYVMIWEDLCKAFSKMIYEKAHYCYSYGMLNGNIENDNGGFYFTKVNTFLDNKNFRLTSTPDIKVIKYYMPMIDINTLKDFADAKVHALTLKCGRFK